MCRVYPNGVAIVNKILECPFYNRLTCSLKTPTISTQSSNFIVSPQKKFAIEEAFATTMVIYQYSANQTFTKLQRHRTISVNIFVCF